MQRKTETQDHMSFRRFDFAVRQAHGLSGVEGSEARACPERSEGNLLLVAASGCSAVRVFARALLCDSASSAVEGLLEF
jgi:hypothetical protein